jgi:hypothetical protein
VIEMLPMARDVALIVLVVEGILLLVLPMLLFWHSIKALRRGRPKVAAWLGQANMAVSRTTGRLNAVLMAVRRPFIWFATAYASLASRLRRAAHLVGSGGKP